MIKLYATDIDHTIYNSEHDAIPAKNIDAINKLVEKGVKVCLVSSRTTQPIMKYVDMFHLKENGGFVVSDTGAVVIDCASGETVSRQCLLDEDVEHLGQLAHKIGVKYRIAYDDHVVSEGFGQIDKYDLDVCDLNIIVTNDYHRFLSDVKPCRVSFYDDNRNVNDIYALIPEEDKERYNFVASQTTVIDVSRKCVSKAAGLQKVLDILGIDGSEVAVTGDGDNDISMFEIAGISGCVANGSQNAKDAATYQLASDWDGGAADFINAYILGEEND